MGRELAINPVEMLAVVMRALMGRDFSTRPNRLLKPEWVHALLRSRNDRRQVPEDREVGGASGGFKGWGAEAGATTSRSAPARGRPGSGWPWKSARCRRTPGGPTGARGAAPATR